MPKKTYSGTSYLCRCECGTEKVISASSLISGGSKSCGCLKKELSRERNTERAEYMAHMKWLDEQSAMEASDEEI